MSGAATATPTLAITDSSYPASVHRLAQQASSRSPTSIGTIQPTAVLEEDGELVAAEPGRCVALGVTDRMRSAIGRSIWSPTPWPSASLTDLKSSRSTNNTTSGSLSGRAHAQGVIHPIEEQCPVGEAGQLVMEGAMAELAFEVALLGHVAERGHHPVDGVPTEQVGDRRLHPPLLAVDAHEAELELHGAPVSELQDRSSSTADASRSSPATRSMSGRPIQSSLRCPSVLKSPGLAYWICPSGVDEHHDVARMLDDGRQPVLALTFGQLPDPGDEAPHPRQRQHDDADGTERRQRSVSTGSPGR